MEEKRGLARCVKLGGSKAALRRLDELTEGPEAKMTLMVERIPRIRM
jgi:hypothetical protein